MGTKGTVRLNEVWVMLDVCLPSYRAKQKPHHWWVHGGRKRAILPLGKHGQRRNPEIEVGHIRHLCNAFDILDCAKEQLEILN